MELAIKYIEDLDLNYLAERLIQKENWKADEALDAVRRYKNFLKLICKNPGVMAPPALDMDEVWHAHILHTHNYTQDCKRIFGKYLHHSPSSGTEEEQAMLKNAGEHFSQLYVKEFGEPFHGVLDVSSFW